MPEPLSTSAHASERVDSWSNLWELYQTRFRNRSNDQDTLWVFRGLPRSSFDLESSLDRVVRRFDIPREEVPLAEEWILWDFQRKASNAEPSLRLPATGRILEWLSLMRHYGAPVRLLDWTYSFFVALFFAAEHADDDFAVWAIDARVCNNRSRKTLPEREEIQRQVKMDPYIQEKDTFCELFSREDPIKLVYRVNPYMLNRRVEVQQGLFLCPGDIRFTFQENLSALLGLHENREPWLVKIVIGKDLQADVLQQLHQMGISSSSLFPGIDGFARSYDSRLAFRDLLIPRKLRDDKHLPYRRPMYDL